MCLDQSSYSTAAALVMLGVTTTFIGLLIAKRTKQNGNASLPGFQYYYTQHECALLVGSSKLAMLSNRQRSSPELNINDAYTSVQETGMILCLTSDTNYIIVAKEMHPQYQEVVSLYLKSL